MCRFINVTDEQINFICNNIFSDTTDDQINLLCNIFVDESVKKPTIDWFNFYRSGNSKKTEQIILGSV